MRASSWTGGESSDFLLLKAVRREGNYMLWINSVSCCYFFFSRILFPINTISWRISGWLLLTRLGIFFSIPVQKLLSTVWTYHMSSVATFFFWSKWCNAAKSHTLPSARGKRVQASFLRRDIRFSSHVTGLYYNVSRLVLRCGFNSDNLTFFVWKIFFDSRDSLFYCIKIHLKLGLKPLWMDFPSWFKLRWI